MGDKIKPDFFHRYGYVLLHAEISLQANFVLLKRLDVLYKEMNEEKELSEEEKLEEVLSMVVREVIDGIKNAGHRI